MRKFGQRTGWLPLDSDLLLKAVMGMDDDQLLRDSWWAFFSPRRTSTHTYTQARTHAQARTSMYTYAQARTHTHTYASTRTRTHTHKHVHTHTYAQSRTHAQARTRAHAQVHTQVYVHMHSHTYCSPGHSLLPHCPMLDHRNRHPAPSPSFPSPPSFLFSESSLSPICGCDRSLVACCPPLTDDTCSERFDWWFPAHLCDLLTACGAINKPERREVR